MIQIRKITLKDTSQVFEIEKESFYTPWTKEAITKEIKENKLSIYLVATIQDVVVGYCGMWHVITEGHITNIAVSKNYRRRGVGSLLLDSLIKIAIEKKMIGLTLEVKISNSPAISLYTKKGFLVNGIRKNYYTETKEDALIMWKYFEVLIK